MLRADRLSFLALTALAPLPCSPAQDVLRAPRVYEDWQGEARLAADLDGDQDIDLIRFEGNATQGIWLSFTVLSNDGSGEFSEAGNTPLPSDCGQHVPGLCQYWAEGKPDNRKKSSNANKGDHWLRYSYEGRWNDFPQIQQQAVDAWVCERGGRVHASSGV